MFRIPQYRPLCPVCIGPWLCHEYHMLRAHRYTGIMDVQQFFNFHGHLNNQLARCGYQGYQWDQDHGFLFSDVREEDEGVWWEAPQEGEEWEPVPEEAADPNALPIFLGASDTTIAALTRKTLSSDDRDDQRYCTMCRSKHEDDTVMVELPCGHTFCEDVDVWLNQAGTCPDCRTRLPEG